MITSSNHHPSESLNPAHGATVYHPPTINTHNAPPHHYIPPSTPNPGQHHRTHSRNQSHSSLASILVADHQRPTPSDPLLPSTTTLFAHHHRRLSSISSLQTPDPSPPQGPVSSGHHPPAHHAIPMPPPSSQPIRPRLSLPSPACHPLEPAPPSFTRSPDPPPFSFPSHRHRHTLSSSNLGSQPASHVRRKSNHQRRASVSTRRESMEIMGGLGIVPAPAPSITQTSESPSNPSHRANWTAYALVRDSTSNVSPSAAITQQIENSRAPSIPRLLHAQQRSNQNSLVFQKCGPSKADSNEDCDIHDAKQPSQCDASPSPYGSHALTSNSMDRARIAALSALECKPTSNPPSIMIKSTLPTCVNLSSIPREDKCSNCDSPSMAFNHKPLSTPSAIFAPVPVTLQSAVTSPSMVGSFRSPTPTLSSEEILSSTRWSSLSELGPQNRKLQNFNLPPKAHHPGLQIGSITKPSSLVSSGSSRMIIAGDLSRVEEEEEEEEEEEDDQAEELNQLHLKTGSNGTNAFPQTMETVLEVEEDLDYNHQSDTNSPNTKSETRQATSSGDHDSIPVRSQVRTHAQTNRFGCTPGAVPNSNRSRLRPKSLALSPCYRFLNQASSITAAPSPATPSPARHNTSSSRDSTFSPATTSPTPAGLKPLSLVSPVNAKISSLAAGFESPFRSPHSRCLPYSANSAGNSTSSFSPSTSHSSFSSIEGPFAGKLARSMMSPSNLSRRSVSYSKACSSGSELQFKSRLSLSSRVRRNSMDDCVVADSPVSECSSIISETSSQHRGSHTHSAWKKRLLQSVVDQDQESLVLKQHQVNKLASSQGEADDEVIGSFGDLVMEDSNEEKATTTTSSGSRVHASPKASQGPDESSGDVLHSKTYADHRIEELAHQSDTALQEIYAGGSTTRQSKVGLLEAEVSEWKERFQHSEFERIQLAEELEGCKVRMAEVEDQLKHESSKLGEYEREIRQKDQFIVELLKRRDQSAVQTESIVTIAPRSLPRDDAGSKPFAGLNFNPPVSYLCESSPTNSNCSSQDQMTTEELKSVQAKLIDEMRDQMFAMASALAEERTNHLATKRALEAAAMQIEVNAIDEEEPALTSFTDDECSPLGTTFLRNTSPNVPEIIHLSASTPGQTFTFDKAPFIPSLAKPSSHSTIQSSSTYSTLSSDRAVPRSTAAHANSSALKFESASVNPFSSQLENLSTGIKAPRSGSRFSSSDYSSDSIFQCERSGAHELKETPKEVLRQDSTLKLELHRRGESFIQHWSFPKGPVLPSPNRIDDPHDRCFFFKPNSLNDTFPPVEPNAELVMYQPFFFSELQIETEDQSGSQDHLEVDSTNILVPMIYEHSTCTDLSSGSAVVLSDIVEEEEDQAETPELQQDGQVRTPAGQNGDSDRSRESHTNSSCGSEDQSKNRATRSDPPPQTVGLKSRLSLQNLSSWVGAYVGGRSTGSKSPPEARRLDRSPTFGSNDPNDLDGLPRVGNSARSHNFNSSRVNKTTVDQTLRSDQLWRLKELIENSAKELKMTDPHSIRSLCCLDFRVSTFGKPHDMDSRVDHSATKKGIMLESEIEEVMEYYDSSEISLHPGTAAWKCLDEQVIFKI